MVDFIPRGINYIFPIFSTESAKPFQTEWYDAWFILFSTVALTYGRYVVQYLFAPKAAEVLKIQQKDKAKFGESTWKCIVYLAFMVWEILLISETEWFWDYKQIWYRYPDIPVEPSLRFFYLIQMGFYLHCLFTLVSFETKRSDYWALWGHHIVTFWLIFASFSIGWLRVGHMILFCHDTSDLLLEMSKTLVYRGNETAANIMFVIFMLSWLLLRLILFPFGIIGSLWREAPKVVPLDIHFMRPPFAILLTIIAALNVYWFAMIVKLAIRVVLRQKIEDPRELDEDEE